MDTPKLHIAGREITPNPPKMKVWREFLAFFDADKEGLSLEDFLDEHVRLIILGFGRDDVTKEVIDENVDVADIVPLTRSLFRWIQSLTFSKLVNLPNGETEKEAQFFLRTRISCGTTSGCRRLMGGRCRKSTGTRLRSCSISLW